MRRAAWIAGTIGALAAVHLFWTSLALPSIATILIAADLLMRRLGHPPFFGPDDRALFLTIVAVFGSVLYASWFGFLPLDVYRFGFTWEAPLALAFVAALTAPRCPRAAFAVLVVLVLFDVRLLQSRNLFDYLLDPLVTVATVVWCVRRLVARRARESGSDQSRHAEPARHKPRAA